MRQVQGTVNTYLISKLSQLDLLGRDDTYYNPLVGNSNPQPKTIGSKLSRGIQTIRRQKASNEEKKEKTQK